MISVTIEYFIKPGQEAQYETLADRIQCVHQGAGFTPVSTNHGADNVKPDRTVRFRRIIYESLVCVSWGKQ